MDYSQFERMFHRLRRLEERHPFLYRVKLFIIAALGYFFLFAFILVSIFIILFSFLIFSLDRLHIVVALLNGILLFFGIHNLLSLWVRVKQLPFPDLLKEEAPQLYIEAENVAREMKGPSLQRIFFSDEERVYIVPHPKWGLLGRNQYYLVVGIPMMLGLRPEEFRALLAKEIGFYSKKHDGFLAWIYRVNKTWGIFSQSLGKRQGFPRSFVVTRFFSWYIPYLSVHAVVLSFKQEYRGDRCSARVVGAPNVANLLVRLELNYLALQRNFWKNVYSTAEFQSTPPHDVYTQMETFLKEPYEPKEAALWLEEILQIKANKVNVEPSLSDRLEKLGEKDQLPEPLKENALGYYLASADRVFRVLNHYWRNQIKENWLDTYHQNRDRREELDQLNEKSLREHLNPEEKMERAFLTGELMGEAQSYPLFEKNAQEEPNDPKAQFYFGKILLSKNNPKGVEYLLRAIELDDEARINGFPMIQRFYLERGEEKEAEKFAEKVLEANQIMQTRRRAKTSIFPQDCFVPHGLSDSFIQEVKGQLKHYTPVLQAYLVRKELEFPSNEPVFFLGLTILRPLYLLTPASRKKYERKLAEKIINELNFPKWLTIVVFDYETSDIRKKMKNIKGSRLF